MKSFALTLVNLVLVSAMESPRSLSHDSQSTRRLIALAGANRGDRVLKAIGAFACLLALALPAYAQARRVEVPIRQTVLQDDLIHYSLDITVGGAPVEAMLDSGST